MEEIVVCVIGGCGFLGQHIVRELQIWNKRQKERRQSHSTTNASCHDSKSLDDDEGFEQVFDIEKAMDSDDQNILHKDDDDDADFETRHINIKEIKILDIKPFEPFFEFSENPPISVKRCDIRLESQISDELEGVKVVFHCAAELPSLWTKSTDDVAEREALYWETNLEGTENIIWGCKKADVKILIYTSTIITVMGGKLIASHTETLSPAVKESDLLLGAYAKSRRRAEDVIINAHKSSTEKDGQLLTTVLRPMALYGEGDKRFIPSLIEMAKRSGGKLPPLGTNSSYHQLTYAGNAAYAHICAMKQLMRKAVHPLRDCGGVAIYVCDDSPYGNSTMILTPFLQNFGLTVTPNGLPLFVTLLFSAFVDMWSSIWKQVGCRSGLETYPSYKLQSIAGKTTIVNRTRAELSLQFRPIYTWNEAKESSLIYYEKLIEEKAMKP